jgi:hypothetical protein
MVIWQNNHFVGFQTQIESTTTTKKRSNSPTIQEYSSSLNTTDSQPTNRSASLTSLLEHVTAAAAVGKDFFADASCNDLHGSAARFQLGTDPPEVLARSEYRRRWNRDTQKRQADSDDDALTRRFLAPSPSVPETSPVPPSHSSDSSSLSSFR